MFRQSRSFAIVALAVSALAITGRPALADDTNTSIQQSVATATQDFLVQGVGTTAAAQGGQSSNGRARPAEGFGIGVKIGPLFTSYSQANQSFNTDTGWEGGIWFGGNRGGRVGVMGEILYAQKKKSTGSLTGTTLQYLEIPILARINVGSRSRSGVSVYGLVGPVFDINLKAKLNNVDVKSQYESLDLGILGGVGVEVTRFLVEMRYNKGLKNVLKGGGGNTTDITSHSFAVLFGVRFN
ncbi:MAG: porin family protein [Vicinamibacterales bacterium]